MDIIVIPERIKWIEIDKNYNCAIYIIELENEKIS